MNLDQILVRLLAGMESANLSVVELFCMLHDTQRRNERRDPSLTAAKRRAMQSLSGVFGSTYPTKK